MKTAIFLSIFSALAVIASIIQTKPGNGKPISPYEKYVKAANRTAVLGERCMELLEILTVHKIKAAN
jgi:hypothetical protein